MQYRTFGTTGLQVSALSLGCYGMSGVYGPADEGESIATLHRAFDLGVNLLDTSASYGSGHNQQLIAKALKGRRERIVIHSKSGSPRTPDGAGNRGGSKPEYLRRVCEESLRRLEIDTLDVFCMSRVDPDVPVEESVGEMARLVEEGKVRWLGLSEASVNSVRRAQKVHPIVSLQMEYSLWSRDAEVQGQLDVCRELGMAFMAYGPLGHGFLAGATPDPDHVPEHRRKHPRYQPGNLEHNLRLLSQLQEFAQEKGISLPQLALAWLLARGSQVIPIPGAKTRAHLEENLAALAVALTPDDLAWLDAAIPYGAPAGDRTSEMSRVNV
ncbi:MAG TPA: aldo/keto reductase [Chloroflexota bacterium]|nr:aldo/keto reductase [Chloroflexota bacterium]